MSCFRCLVLADDRGGNVSSQVVLQRERLTVRLSTARKAGSVRYANSFQRHTLRLAASTSAAQASATQW